jgi:hypothetical protein
LRTGKLVEAKTIEDVRRFYGPRFYGPGCTTADVMKAIYCLIAQSTRRDRLTGHRRLIMLN